MIDTILNNNILFREIGMERNKIIIIALLVVIAVLLVGIFASMPNFTKADSKLEIIGNDTLAEGDSLQVKLTDANGTALANQSVNITVTDKDSSRDYHSVVTNDDGIGTLKLDKSAGEYTIIITYGGNNEYNSCNATQKITIKEKATQTEQSTTGNSLEQYRTRSDTDIVLTQSGHVVELNRAGDIVSVDGDPNKGGH